VIDLCVVSLRCDNGVCDGREREREREMLLLVRN